MRCLVLTKINKIPFNASFGTVVAERAFDFICLLFLMAVSLLLEFERFKDFFYPLLFSSKSDTDLRVILMHPLILIGLILSIIGVLILFFFRKKILLNYSILLIKLCRLENIFILR